MKEIRLPADSRRYTERAFLEKEKWHRRRKRMSLTRKIETLDRLLKMAKDLPRLGSHDGAPGQKPGRSSPSTQGQRTPL
jgi:hypothetical protein